MTRGEGDWSTLILIYQGYYVVPKISLDILCRTTLPDSLMVQLFFCRSDGHTSFIDLLLLDATSVTPPRVVPFLLRTSTQVLRPNQRNRHLMVLRLNPPNRRE
jgi:hypothetical protein